jgi:hypothetical protein
MSRDSATRPEAEEMESNELRRRQKTIELLQSWDAPGDDDEEQRKALAYLKRVLDEDRPEQRKLFPRQP